MHQAMLFIHEGNVEKTDYSLLMFVLALLQSRYCTVNLDQKASNMKAITFPFHEILSEKTYFAS